jgi:hypothetical protein
MLRDHGGPYTDWLAHADRVLEMRASRDQEKK